MQAPSAALIYIALDGMPKVPGWLRKAQIKELEEAVGAKRLEAIGIKELSEDVKLAYELGLQTARAALAMNAGLVMANVQAEDLL
jgi:hypothetical protein